MPTARGYLAIGVVNGKIYAIGGYNGSFPLTNQEYDPATNSWTTKASMLTGRDILAIGVVNNKIYAIGGWGGTNHLSTNEEYTPGVLGIEENFFNLSVEKTGILIRFFGESYKWDIYKAEENSDFHFLTRVKNSKKYLDKEVKPGKRYGYKLKVEERWFGTLWIEFPEKLKERIISVYPNPLSNKIVLFISSNESGEKEIFISDVAGRKEDLFKGFIPKGTHKIEINTDKRKGVYFIILGKDKKKIVLY